MLSCICVPVTPHTQCRLKLLKQERIKDYLLMEEEFIRNQEQMKPLEEKQEVCPCDTQVSLTLCCVFWFECKNDFVVCLFIFFIGREVEG